MNAAEPLGRRILVNTGALASANLWRILVSFLIQLMVARRLGLESLGHYTVAMAFLNVSQVLCELGLPLWMVRELAQRPQARRAFFWTALLLQGGMALLLWGGLALAAGWLPYAPDLRGALWWVGASLPLFALSSAAGTIFQAGERLELLLWVEGITNTTILVASLVILAGGGTVTALLVVVVAAQTLSAAVSLALLAHSRLLSAAQDRVAFAWRDLARGATSFFGLSLSDVLLQRVDILLLSLLGDARLLGVYSAAYNLVRVVVKLVQSYWRALYPTLSRLQQQDPAHGRVLSADALRYLWLLCAGGAALVTGTAGVWIALIYGAQDGAAATALAWLVWIAPLFCVELYATTRLLVERRARAALGVGLWHVLALAGLILPLAAQFGAQGAVWANLLAQGSATAAALVLTGVRVDTLPWRRLGGLVASIAAVTFVALWLPGPLWLRGVVVLFLYAGLVVGLGWLTRTDMARLQKALHRSAG